MLVTNANDLFAEQAEWKKCRLCEFIVVQKDGRRIMLVSLIILLRFFLLWTGQFNIHDKSFFFQLYKDFNAFEKEMEREREKNIFHEGKWIELFTVLYALTLKSKRFA